MNDPTPAPAPPHLADLAAEPPAPASAAAARPAVEPAAANASPATPASAPAVDASGSAAVGAVAPVWLLWGALAVALISLALAVWSQQRLQTLEQELVRRQQDAQGQTVEAKALAKQAVEAGQHTEAKLALLDARVAESALQRGQLEDLLQQLSRSRDENALADIDSALRVALQHSAITGSAEPVLTALQQAEERMQRLGQPRLERARRAVARDLAQYRSLAVADVATLTIRLDEVIRGIDELPLVADLRAHEAASGRAAAASAAAPAASAGLSGWAQGRGAALGTALWREVKSLLRVSRIEQPEAILVAPEQAFFLRENLKLRLLNARLALQSRQMEAAQGDLRAALLALERYFDIKAKRVENAQAMLRQIATQSRLISLPRPEETLAALAAAQAGR